MLDHFFIKVLITISRPSNSRPFRNPSTVFYWAKVCLKSVSGIVPATNSTSMRTIDMHFYFCTVFFLTETLASHPITGSHPITIYGEVIVIDTCDGWRD